MIKNYVILFLGIFILTACRDWLDVQPKTTVREDRLFSKESGFTETLNGIYNLMQSSACYGFELTMGLTEIMAQRWNIGTNHNLEKENEYAWKDASVKYKIDGIWTQLYKIIAEINFLLVKVNDPASEKVLSNDVKKMLLGELYGLRGFIHADILRLFGPIYFLEKDKVCLPYYDNFQVEIPAPMITAELFMSKILADLDKATSFLQEDPVVNKLEAGNVLEGKQENLFYSYRGLRMNYYAVKACQARMLLYAGKTDLAQKAALEVIKSNLFPFVKVEDVAGATNPDRIFKTEVIFGVYTTKLKSVYENYFAKDGSYDFLTSTNKALNIVFENNMNDIRFGGEFWMIPLNKVNHFFYKYSAAASSSNMTSFVIPLIRVSEMYYILAECDQENGYTYLNDVRKARRIGEADSNHLEDEILMEYIREFWGEGQLIYYYKRKNIDEILAGDGQNTINMSAWNYMLPIPESETDTRDVE